MPAALHAARLSFSRTGLYAGELPAELKNIPSALAFLFLSGKPQPPLLARQFEGPPGHLGSWSLRQRKFDVA